MTDAQQPPHRFAQPNFSQADTFITPELAREMLAFNGHNRKPHDHTLSKYTSDMKEGRWRETHIPILFDRAGVLIDGQHRLRAIIASGVPLRTTVVCGLDPACRDAIDIGKQRSIADILSLAGFSYSALTAAVARLVIAFERGTNLFSTHVSAPMIEEFVLLRPYLIEVVALVGSRHFPAPSSMLGAICYLANNEDRRHDNAIAGFLDGLNTGANLSTGDPRLTLRNWIAAEQKRPARGHHLSRQRTFAAIARAWSAYARQESLALIRDLPTGAATNKNVFIFGRPPPPAPAKARQQRPAENDGPQMAL